MTEWKEYQSDSEYARSRDLDPSSLSKVSEMVELYEKVRSDVRRPMRRPGVEGARADACLARSMRTCTGARVFASTPALISSQLLDLLRLTLVTDHE